MKREQFVTICFITLLVFIIIQIFRIFSPFFDAIFWSAILTFGFYPLHMKLRSLGWMNETISALVMTSIIFLIVIPPLVFVFINLTTQAIEVYQLTTNYIREGRFEQLIEQIRTWKLIQRIESDFLQWDPLKAKATEWLLNSSKALANFSMAQVGTITKNLFFVLLNTMLAVLLVFIFLKDGEKIYNFIYQITPLAENTKAAVFSQINGTFGAVIRGQMLTSLTQSLIAGIIFGSLNLPAPIFFAVATFLLSLIPILGAQMVWVPLVVYLVVSQQITKAVILFLLGVLVISLIDNIMKPALIGEKTKLPYILLFFGILGGLKIYGLMGVFLAPVILSLFFALVKIYRESFA